MKLFILLSISMSLFAMQSPQQWDGTHYKHNSSPQFRTAMELLSTQDLSKCSYILDVGSGSGQVTAEMARIAPTSQTVGIDFSQSMVDEAHTTYKETKNLSFFHVDAQNEGDTFFAHHANQFDLAFSSAVFLWIENKQTALNNIHTVLKSGGHMLVKTTAPRPKEHPLNRALMALAQNPKWASFAQAYMSKPQSFPISIEQAHQIITPEKWTNISITDRGITNLYDCPEEFCSWMQGWMGGMPAVAALKKENQIELCQDFVNEYVKLTEAKNTEGKIVYSLSGILIEADKK